MSKTNLNVRITSIQRQTTKKDGVTVETNSYWGEAVGAGMATIPFRIGADQVNNLMKQAGVFTPQQLQGRFINLNLIGYEKDKDGKEKAGAFIVNKYIDKDGVEVSMEKPRLIIGGLVNINNNFMPGFDLLADFASMPTRTDKPLQVAVPEAPVAKVSVPQLDPAIEVA